MCTITTIKIKTPSVLNKKGSIAPIAKKPETEMACWS